MWRKLAERLPCGEAGVLAAGALTRDHPAVQILLLLGSEVIGLLYFTAILLLVGATAFHFLIWSRTALPIGPVRNATEEQMDALVVRWGTWSAAAYLLLTIPRAMGVASLLSDRFPLGSRLSALILRSEWGVGFAAAIVAGVLAWTGYLLVGKRRPIGWWLVLLSVPVLAAGAGLQGHPFDAFSTLTLAPIFDGLHAVVVGGWLGSFFYLVLAERRLQAHTASPWTDPLGAMIERYFRVSGPLGTAVLLTGLFSSSTHLTGFDDIQGSPYGRLLAGKVAIVAILFAFHEYHRRHAERQARTGERAQLVHTMRFQAGLIALVLALTALLADTTPPGVNEVRSEVFRSAPRGAADSRDVELPR
ncbi:MAG TPA: CopD family protein [Gemmatimonadaceae bacterium]|jgi:putative copper export protein